MKDARISVALPTHPKTKKHIRRVGEAGAWRLICLFLWVAQSRSDGDLSGMDEEDIELAADWRGEPGTFVSALTEVGFLDGTEGEYRIHDWEEHNPWAAGSNRRSEKAKGNALKKWGAKTGGDSLTNAQKRSARLAEARTKGTHSKEEWDALKDVCGNSCVSCGAGDLDLSKDHILAICKGASDGIDNIQPLCHKCNASKGANGVDMRPPNWRQMLSERLQNACEKTETPNKMFAPSPSPSPSQEVNPPFSEKKKSEVNGGLRARR